MFRWAFPFLSKEFLRCFIGKVVKWQANSVCFLKLLMSSETVATLQLSQQPPQELMLPSSDHC